MSVAVEQWDWGWDDEDASAANDGVSDGTEDRKGSGAAWEQIRFEHVTTEDALRRVCNRLLAAPFYALDTETTSLDPRKGKIRLVSLRIGNDTFVIDLFAFPEPPKFFFDALNEVGRKGIRVLGQNLRFDQMWLLHHHGVEFGPIFDSYRASAAIYNGLFYKHDLYSIYERELGVHPKAGDLGGSNWAGSLTREQLAYAAEDVTHMQALREKLAAHARERGLFKACEIDSNAILPEAAMMLAGFRLNPEKFLRAYEKQKAEAARLRKELLQELPNPKGQLSLFEEGGSWNLASSQQLAQSLMRLGVYTEEMIQGKLKRLPVSMTPIVLAAYAKEIPLVGKVLKYKKADKRSTAFGPDYLKWLHPVTKRIHAGYYPFTGTGRYACVTGDTQVRTFEGYRRMDEIRVGDLVWTHKGRWRKVLAVFDQGVQPVTAMRLSNGRTVKCTIDHRFLVQNVVSNWKSDVDPSWWYTKRTVTDWVHVRDLRIGATFFTGPSAPRVSVVFDAFEPDDGDARTYSDARTYDISVEEDESYETEGVFSHNCSQPNLQQLPRDKEYREAFDVEDDRTLTIADYSQVELVIMAELTQDEMLMNVYRRKEDAHATTASIVNEVPIGSVTKSQRQQAKPINFGLIYGLGAKKLVTYSLASYGVEMTEKEAQTFRRKFFDGYRGIARWHQMQINYVKPTGVARTLSGRMRHLRDIDHNAFLNSPCQGTGADGLKISLRYVYDALKKFGGAVQMVHMVHDEIILEGPNDPEVTAEAERVLSAEMVRGMSELVKSVPVVAEAGSGRSWADK